jgi:site-specific recombinase XerD
MHQFRHTCASDLLARGVHLPEVQRILGHAAICSTMWYLSVSDESRKEAMAKHPINEFLEAQP